MESTKQVQASNKTIASGFIALRDRDGNLIYKTAAVDSNRQIVRDQQNAPFRICAAIQNHLSEKNLDPNRELSAGTEQNRQIESTAAARMNAEHRSEK